MTFSEKFNQAYDHVRAAFEIFDELNDAFKIFNEFNDVFNTDFINETMAEDFLEAFETLTSAADEVKQVRDEWSGR